MNRPVRRSIAAFSLASAFLLGACEADPVDPIVDPPTGGIDDVVLVSAAGEDLLWSHGDHFHGTLYIGLGESLELDVLFAREGGDDHDAPPAGSRFDFSTEADVRVDLTPSESGVIEIVRGAPEDRRFEIRGVAEGNVRMNIEVRHRNRLAFEATDLRVIVRTAEEGEG